MFLARVIGSVVSTKKDEAMKGRKLVLLRPQLVDEANPAQLRPGTRPQLVLLPGPSGPPDLETPPPIMPRLHHLFSMFTENKWWHVYELDD